MSDQMDIAVSRQLLATSRAFQQLADQTIKKDPVRALIELITNSDDSYKKLEKLGIGNDGLITITFKRARGSATLRITDHALGMSSELMDEAVGMYGSDTHGFEEGEGGRSFFGRGLKEAILSMGEGFVQSIQNNFFHQCVLNIQEYKRATPKEAAQSYKNDLEILSRGTRVTLNITRPGIRIPQFDTLKRALELHYALRDILSSPKRNVVLIEIGQNSQAEHRVKLQYVYPKRDLIIATSVNLPEYERIKIDLEVYRSQEALSGREDGYMRQSGILICSQGAIHDITLFKFEGEDLARYLSGRLTCDHIDVLLRRNESIVLDSRDGLDWSHSFNKALRSFVEKQLEKYIVEEKEKQKEKQKPIESELMKKKFRKTLDKLNKIAEVELRDFERVGIGNRPGSMLPPNGFDFLPNYYHIIVGKKSTLTLKVMENSVGNDREINISSDSPNIHVLNKEVMVNFPSGPMQVVHVYIEGKQIGDVGRIVAKTGNIKAEATVHVVAEKTFNPDTPPKNPKHRGMFKDIQYDPNADPHQRVRYDRVTGAIVVATSSPSVRLYLGDNDLKRFEYPENLVMAAELVTQAVCRELAKRKYEFEPSIGEPEETLNAIYNKLVDQYAHIIHSLLGPFT